MKTSLGLFHLNLSHWTPDGWKHTGDCTLTDFPAATCGGDLRPEAAHCRNDIIFFQCGFLTLKIDLLIEFTGVNEEKRKSRHLMTASIRDPFHPEPAMEQD